MTNKVDPIEGFKIQEHYLERIGINESGNSDLMMQLSRVNNTTILTGRAKYLKLGCVTKQAQIIFKFSDGRQKAG